MPLAVHPIPPSPSYVIQSSVIGLPISEDHTLLQTNAACDKTFCHASQEPPFSVDVSTFSMANIIIQFKKCKRMGKNDVLMAR